MKVKELMTQDVRWCGMGDSLNRAAQLMWENDCGVIPVVDDERRVVGIVTDRDICMAAYTQGVAIKESGVASAMSRKVYSCTDEGSVEQVASLMREIQVRRVPVVDSDGRLVGMISLNDIARCTHEERATKSKRRSIKAGEVVETLSAICVPKKKPVAASEIASPARAEARIHSAARRAKLAVGNGLDDSPSA